MLFYFFGEECDLGSANPIFRDIIKRAISAHSSFPIFLFFLPKFVFPGTIQIYIGCTFGFKR